MSGPRGAGAEEANVAQTDFAEVAAAQHAFGALPLIVITHAAPPPSSPADANKALANEALLDETQRQDAQIAHLSSNSEQILALRSGHYIQQDQPGVVIDAVRQVIDAVRHHAALPHRGQVLRAG